MDKKLNFKNKLLLFVFIFFIIIPSVLAAEKSIFSNKVFVGNVTTAEGKNLSVAIEGNTAAVDYGDLGFIIDEGDCETDDFVKVCVLELDGEFSAKLSISVIIADVEIQKGIKENKTEFVV